jgi:superkiller protein 8
MDIFTLAVTDKQILSGGGDPAIKVHSTTGPEFPLVQSIDNAHDIGCHHLVTDGTGTRAASAGFDGKLKIWSCQDGYWALDQKLSGGLCPSLINWNMLTRTQPT